MLFFTLSYSFCILSNTFLELHRFITYPIIDGAMKHVDTIKVISTPINVCELPKRDAFNTHTVIPKNRCYATFIGFDCIFNSLNSFVNMLAVLLLSKQHIAVRLFAEFSLLNDTPETVKWSR